jgi:hypothetical protein
MSKIRKDTLSFLPPERLNELRKLAKDAVGYALRGEMESYVKIIDYCNKTFTKHEKGLFCGFGLSEVNNAN